MKSTFEQLSWLLGEVWPAVSAIHWPRHGEKITAYDESRVPKWTGVIMHFVDDGPVLGMHTQTHGFLPNPAASAEIVVRKVRLLLDHPDRMSSMELRNPEEKKYGGGIWASDSVTAAAISGLPEIGDHLLMARMMLRVGLLTEEDWKLVTDAHSRYMTAAREHVGMSSEQFESLKNQISDIDDDAHRTMTVG